MPNWCENEVSIYADNKQGEKELRKFLDDCFIKDEEKQGIQLDFELVIPYPVEAPERDPETKLAKMSMAEMTQTPFAKWYSDHGYYWCIENWGSKWNAHDFEMEDDSVYYGGDSRIDTLRMQFVTAWCPPYGIHEKIKEMLPNCSMQWFYREDGMQKAGYL